MNIISRKEAKTQGLKRYFTGKSCKRGHVCERRIYGDCIECKLEYRENHKEQLIEYDKERYETNNVFFNEQSKKWYKNNREETLKRVVEYRKVNKERINAYSVKYHQENRDTITKRKKKYRKDNPDKVAMISSKRRAVELCAVPKWYESEKEFMIFLKQCARELTESGGIQYDIDHIIPLQSKKITIKANDNCTDTDWTGAIVCGLHCIANLQILTKSENCKKHNKFKG